MKKITVSVVAAVISSLALTSCALVQTPGTREMKNLKTASPVVVAGSENFASKLSGAGACDRGVAEIDVMNDVGAFAKHEGAIFISGKAYFTSKPWADDAVQAFHVLGYEKGEPTFPNGADVSIPFLANESMVVAQFFNGSKASKNAIADGDPISQAKGIDLSAVLKDQTAQAADASKAGLYLDKSYAIQLNRGEGKRLKNYYLGNLPDKSGHVDGFGLRNSMGKSVVYGEEASGFGVGDFTHMAFGKPGLGYGIYMVPADVESKEKTLGTVKSVEEGGTLEFAIGERGELPPETKAAYITVTLEHANKEDKLNPLRYHVEDKGQKTVAVPLEGLSTGSYKMVVQRGYLYSSEVKDEAGGNYCVYIGADASSQVNVTEKADA